MNDDDVIDVSGSPPRRTADVDLMRRTLRNRWELASVLHFLHVFEPVMETNLKLSAEEIETGLIEFNDTLVQLHIALLKGIAPRSNYLNGTDAWGTLLCRILSEWWPWVAQGDCPLTAAKGEELSRYKELDPTIRLLILKALCEVRANEDDIVSYINDEIKGSTGVSNFRKEKIGEDESGTVYWYDGNETTGHRLYKEVCQPKVKGKETIPEIYSQWETVATNLEEFRRVVDEFSASEVELEVAVSKAVEADAIPALEKLQKKKEAALRRKQREDMLLNGFQTSRLTRSSRNLRPINYRYDEYDKDIKEAIKVTQNRKTIEERKCKKSSSNEGFQQVTESMDCESTESDTDIDRQPGGDDFDESSDSENDQDKEYVSTDIDRHPGGGDVDESSDSEYDHEEEDVGDEDKEKVNYVAKENNEFSKKKHYNLRGQNNDSVPENININSKNRLRQRPSRKTSIDCTVVPDSEEGNSSEDSGD